jgi:Zn ribbon nucleic-acid-binding protein
MANPCKHPKVRVVSRTEDAEYVECVECGEVFDSDEFRDMEIEEKVANASDDDSED